MGQIVTWHIVTFIVVSLASAVIGWFIYTAKRRVPRAATRRVARKLKGPTR
jgi:hypothetical protein